MPDKILDLLSEARAAAAEVSETSRSREISLVVTKIDEAIQWRETDLKLKKAKGVA